MNGCFWHAHEGCPYFVHPKTNTEFWEKKFARNRERDRRVCSALAKDHWRVLVVWECELKGKEQRKATLNGLAHEIWEIAGK